MKHFLTIAAIVLTSQAQAACEDALQARFDAYKAIAQQAYPKSQALKKVTSEVVATNPDWYGRTLPRSNLVQLTCGLFWAHTDAVIAHELGHVIAYDTISNSDEQDADRIAATLLNMQVKEELVSYMDNQCLIGKTYFCGRVATWKQIFN